VVGSLTVVAALSFAVAIQGTVRLHALNVASANFSALRPSAQAVVLPTIYAVIVAALAVAMWRANARVDAVTAVFFGAAFASQRYLGPWYWLSIIPWTLPITTDTRQVSSNAVGFAKVAMTAIIVLASDLCDRRPF
jgi:hypothetical protein